MMKIGSRWGTSVPSEYTLEFYLGAATMGEDPNKWSAPGRDLPFLYMRKFAHGRDCTIEPDWETWMRYGLVLTLSDTGEPAPVAFADVAAVMNHDTLLGMLRSSPGTYLKESKDAKLDRLGCP